VSDGVIVALGDCVTVGVSLKVELGDWVALGVPDWLLDPLRLGVLVADTVCDREDEWDAVEEALGVPETEAVRVALGELGTVGV